MLTMMKNYRFYVDFDLTEVATIEASNEQEAWSKIKDISVEDFITLFKLPQNIGLGLANFEMFSEDFEDFSDLGFDGPFSDTKGF